MSENHFLESIERMNDLIRRSATGTPGEFAEKLNISESTLYNYLNNLKYDFDAPIAYCRYKRSYYYEREGNILVGFVSLSRREINKIRGGSSMKLLPLFFCPHSSICV